MNNNFVILAVFILASLVLSACGAPATWLPLNLRRLQRPRKRQRPNRLGLNSPRPKGTLVAFPVDATPTLDGVVDDAAWMDAHEVVIPVANGFNNFSTVVWRKAVYGVDTVYFLVSYADSTESWFRSPWQKQKDGTWKKITDPNDKGGDNNTVYWESRFF